METITQFLAKYETIIEILLYISTSLSFAFAYTFLKSNEKFFAFMQFLISSAGIYALYYINQL